MEDKYKKIGNLLRKSIDADYCYECPFDKMCAEIHEQETGYFLCDDVRVMAIEKKLKEFEENTWQIKASMI